MKIKRLTATFGRLENETLRLEPGLNIIEAPNERGKSTWTAFLRVMLYGLNTRDRSANADKRRYLPWSGSAMQGVLEADTCLGDVTITRSTVRANAPMGAFSAVRTGTSEPVAGLTAASCGEALLGVPLEVYERSAYIRQSGLAVDQNAALERRIAALITTGEEDTSYTDAADRLRRQLTRRRYNKTGLLPQAERELEELERTAAEGRILEESCRRWEAELEAAQAQNAALTADLRRHDQADAAQAIAQVQQAREAWEAAKAEARQAADSLGDLPDAEALQALRGSLDALEPVAEAVRTAEEREEAAAQAMAHADEALAVHPLAGRTPEEAASLAAETGPRPALSPLGIALPLLAGAAAAAVTALAGGGWLAAVLGLAVLAVALAAFLLPLRGRQAAWDRQQETLDRQRQEAPETYTILYEKAAQARTAWRDARSARDALAASFDTNLDRCLEQVRTFAPAEDLADAQRAVDAALDRQAAAREARRREEAARLRWELCRDQAPQAPAGEVERPAVSREALQARLRENAAREEGLRRQLHTAQGRLQALGDPLQLQAEAEETARRREDLQREYDAIALAQEVLDRANAELQSRFSPALGEKSAEIFTKLTGGKYNKVLLNRDMAPSAQEAGGMLPRQAALLSQGTADQLYLAVRLAICQMVLPAEQAAPILLDDALVTFDDNRLAAALDYLAELGAERQILLFTCQSREARCLRETAPGKFHVITL